MKIYDVYVICKVDNNGLPYLVFDDVFESFEAAKTYLEPLIAIYGKKKIVEYNIVTFEEYLEIVELYYHDLADDAAWEREEASG